MKVEIKDYGSIGVPRLLNLKVIKLAYEDLINDKYLDGEVLYEGVSEEIPTDIAKLHYYKLTLGNSTVYYVIKN